MIRIPKFNEATLRRPEALGAKILEMLHQDSLKEYHDVALVAQICLQSSATNDYLEKIAMESIGAKHLTAKLGPDGELNGKGVEAKPSKGSTKSDTGGVVNDDSPMKLLNTHNEYSLLTFVNATKDGARINWACTAPYHYWEQARFTNIIKRLGLSEWKWGDVLPANLSERKECLEDLVKFHKKNTYVRSNPLKLSVLDGIPDGEVEIWKHPDVTWKQLPLALKKKADQP
jgi:hypothetical protein